MQTIGKSTEVQNQGSNLKLELQMAQYRETIIWLQPYTADYRYKAKWWFAIYSSYITFSTITSSGTYVNSVRMCGAIYILYLSSF